MNHKFQKAVALLHPAFKRLIRALPYAKGQTLPAQGVYLFREKGKKGKAIYVGRSNKISRRFRDHTGCNSGINRAALAVRIAREEIGLCIDYSKGARKRLLENCKFKDAFERAKKHIRAMEFRAVEECDQTQQALLEIYCAIELKARYNDFGTH